MDEFDRPDCALENLEQVVSLNPNDRALTGDSIFRLIKLYKRAGEQERLTQLIRKYWELGKKRNDASVPASVPARLSSSTPARAHLPPSAR